MTKERHLGLTPTRRQVLAAAVARILPSGDGPGAAETGVMEYVAGALEEPRYQHLAPLFERGLDFLQALAQQKGGADFVARPEAEQDEILREAQGFPNNDARRFFESLILLSIEGFLCHPKHGGNRGFQGWRYLGYESDAAQVADCPARQA